ncbi:MAG TPA: YkgJ family cysteine cluster protein [Polyangia bacterium]
MELSLVAERYRCTGCGDCCRGWSVPLLPGEADRFRALGDGIIPAERLRGAIHAERSGGIGVEALAGPAARCAALTDDERCLVHAAHGGEVKPLACRVFPLTFVATPTEVRVSLSFACPAVIDGEGPPLGEQRDEVERTWRAVAVSPYRLDAGGEIALVDGRMLPWSDAALLLAEASRALRADGSLVERLCRAGATVALTIAQLDEGRAFADALDAARAGRDQLAREALAARPAPDRLSRALLRTIVDSTAPGARGSGSRLFGALASLGGGGGRVRIAGGEVAQGEVDRVARGLPADGEALLARWLDAELHGLTFFGAAGFELSLAGGLDLLTLATAAVARVARAHAAHAGRAAVARDDVKGALRQVYAGIHHRAAMPPRFERALAATAGLDLLRDELGEK